MHAHAHAGMHTQACIHTYALYSHTKILNNLKKQKKGVGREPRDFKGGREHVKEVGKGALEERALESSPPASGVSQ